MNVLDLFKKCKRGPAIILPKDAGTIVANTGVAPGWKVVDAGSGSGYLSIFLGNLGCKVFTYEIKEEFYKKAKKNIEKSGFKIKIYNKDITKGIKEKNVDLVTLDMQYPEKVIPLAFKALKKGGWIAVYSMHVEQMKKVVNELSKHDFSEPKIVQSVQFEWQTVKNFTRPKTWALGHTGFLTFARKS